MLQEKLLFGTVDKLAAVIELLKSTSRPNQFVIDFRRLDKFAIATGN